MATKFWKGGGSSTNWNATGNTNWADSSGGANNATGPGTGDLVVFDSASVGPSVINTNYTIQGISCDGTAAGANGAYTGVLTHNSGVTITINTGTADSLRFSSGMTYTPAGASCPIILTHTSGTANIKSYGKSIWTLQINGSGGTTQILDDLLVNAGQNATLTITLGTLDAAGGAGGPFAITANSIQSSAAGTRALILGSAVTCGGNLSNPNYAWYFANMAGLTFTKNSANVTVLGPTVAMAAFNFYPGGITFNDVTLANTSIPAILTLTGANTFAHLSIGAGWNVNFPPNTTNTISNPFTWTGTPQQPLLLAASFGNSNNSTISCPSGSCTVSWATIAGLTGIGGATFIANNSFGCYLGSSSVSTGWQISPPGAGVFSRFPRSTRAFKAGATSQSIDIFIADARSNLGGGLTGLVYNSSGLVAYYRLGATGGSTQITPLATQTVGGAWSSAGFVEIDAVHMPGMYRFDIPDAVLASTPDATLYFQGATNMIPVELAIPIVAYDPNSATDLGLSSVTAIKTQTDKMAFTVTNQIDANIQSVNDVTVNGDGSGGTPWGP